MINKFSNLITNWLIKTGNITYEEKELYIYGLFIFISSSIYFILSAFFGIIFGCLFESIIFYITFQIIRKYAGGYHASTETKCEILSTLCVLLCVLIIRFLILYNYNFELICLTGLATIIIIVLCPLDTIEKPLSIEEFKFFRRISLIILFVSVIIIIAAYCFYLNSILVPCCISLILESILLVAGKIKNYYLKLTK